MFAWKIGEQKGKNLDVSRGPPNITSSGSFETVGLGILIEERLKLTLVFTRGQLCGAEGFQFENALTPEIKLYINSTDTQ